MRIASSSIQEIMNQRPDLIDMKSYEVIDKIMTSSGELIRRTNIEAEKVIDAEISKTVGSIIDIFV